MSGIFDGHSHYMPPEVATHTTFYKVNWSDLDRQLSLMDGLNIEKALLLYPTSDAHLNMGGWARLCGVYNNAILKIVKDHPDRFVGAGIVPFDDQDEMIAELERLHGMGIMVLSMASSYGGRFLDDDWFLPVMAFVQKKKMVIHVHPQIMDPIGAERVSDPLLTPVVEYLFDVTMCIGKMMMNGTFLKYPDIRFIFAHYGGVLPFLKERFDNTYTMLRKRDFVKDLGQKPSQFFENLYFDVSGANSPASLLGALEVTNASHIIFGSDYPANQDISRTISMIENLNISESDKKNILQNSSVLV